MTVEPFKITFSPAQLAVNLLAKIASEPDNPHHLEACVALEAWRNALATPEQIAMVETSDELEVDDAGACVSEGDDGYFIQTWTWVECANTDRDCDVCGCTPEDPVFETLGGKQLCLDCCKAAIDTTDDEDDQELVRNFYRCESCAHEWQDIWSCGADDGCPACGARHMSPYKSEDVV